MQNNHLSRWFCVFFIISFFFLTNINGKGFGGGRGGGFKGGSRGGGIFGGSKSGGTSGGSSSYNRYGNYKSMNQPRSGSSFKSNAMSFGLGMAGGMAAYSLMRSMSPSYRERPGYYEPDYGTGATCVNNEDLNGTRFGSFRCPLNGFPYEAKYCCGDYGKQFCCIQESSSGLMRSTSNLGWLFLIVIICLIAVFIFAKRRRQRQKGVILVPMEPPVNEQQGQPFYHPAPPSMGYPPPPPMGNPYAVPPQNYEGNFNPYSQQYQMPYPPQQQQQQQPINPYQVKEGGPPAYEDVIRNNQGMSTTKIT